ncbi:MAG: amidohydrolase family protein [Sphingomonadaceae bacterium]
MVDITYEMKRDIGFVIDRLPEEQGAVQLPAGTVVVSADNHLTVAEDLFYDRFPEDMKDRAPRVWFEEGAWQIGMDGKTFFPEIMRRQLSKFDVPGMNMNDPIHRQRAMESEGVSKELAFGNNALLLMKYPDFEVRELVWKIYNEFLADCQAKAPGRFYGVGVANFWDPSKTRESIEHIKALGLKTYMIPYKPGNDVNGKPIEYMSEAMEPMWQAIEDAGLPLCFHVGESFQDGPGGMGVASMTNFDPFREVLGQMVFGGIFDRHPRIRVVFVEAGINWVAGAIQDMEMIHGSFNELMYPQLKHAPRWYWDNHCYATFMSDRIGLKLIDDIGADRVMWSSDYPHLESTFGYGWSAMQAVLDTVSPPEARKILGQTAIEVFDLN